MVELPGFAKEPNRSRLGGLAGIAFFALSLAVVPFSLAPPPPPVLGASGAAFAAWYSAHRLGFLVGNFLGVAAFVPGLLQLAALSAAIRDREGEPGFLSGWVLAAGTFTYGVFACSLAAFQAMPFLLDPSVAAGTQAMGVLTSVWFALDGLAALVLVVAVGVSASATGALPRGVVLACWPVGAIAGAMSVGALVTAPEWLAAGGPVTALGFVVFFAWTLAIAIAQLRAAS